jgi:hypothetical protein
MRGLFVEFLDGAVELFEGWAQRHGQCVVVVEDESRENGKFGFEDSPEA